MAHEPNADSPDKHNAQLAAQERKRHPFSGDPSDPEGKSEANRKKREHEERQHGVGGHDKPHGEHHRP